MSKLFKNIHWIIIAVALFNIGSLVKDKEEEITNTQSKQEIQRASLAKAKKLKKRLIIFIKTLMKLKEELRE